jgi:hypothetical protein
MARFSIERCLRGSSSRPQTAPQQYSVTSSCIGMLKSSADAIDLSTYSEPSTSRRFFRPASNIALSMGILLECMQRAGGG